MTLTAAGDWYLSQIARADSGLSARTVADYSATWGRYVVAEGSPIRGLTLEQLNDPQRLTGFLRQVADRHGTGASKMTRSTLSGLFRYAVDNGVLTTNALRQVRAVKSQTVKATRADRERAFTREERDALIAYADAQVPSPEGRPNPRSVRKAQAVADLAALLAGTGVRIDEARSVLWEHVDLVAGTLYVDGTKSNAAARKVNLPEWLRSRLARRAESVGTEGYLIASPASHDPMTKWDQSNSAKALRTVLDGAGFPWAVPHTFRRTVATLLHEAGAPIARIADQLGHSDPSLTARVYLGRDFGGDKADLAAML
jgi:integrase